TVEMVVANLKRNVAHAQRIIRAVAGRVPPAGAMPSCACGGALANAVMTDFSLISAPLRQKYGLFLSKYLTPYLPIHPDSPHAAVSRGVTLDIRCPSRRSARAPRWPTSRVALALPRSTQAR